MFYASFLSFRLRAYDLILIGFPPPDIALRRYMYSVARKCSHAERRTVQAGKRKRRKMSVAGKPSCVFPGCGTFSLLKPPVSRSVPYPDGPRPAPPDRIRPTSSRNSCRSWRRCRPSSNGASGSSRSGRLRGQPAQRVSQKYRLCMKCLLDLWSRVPYNPISLSEEDNTNFFFFFFFSFRRCCGHLVQEIHTIHPSSLPCSALFSLLPSVPHLL
jgi:hypothetical protein